MGSKITCVIKSAALFALWALAVSLIPDVPTDNPAVLQLWHEFTPLAVLAALTALFYFAFDRKKPHTDALKGSPVKLIFCFLTGALLAAAPVIVLNRLGIIKFFGRNYIDTMPIWLLALLLNTAAQELFVRGYIYRLFRRDFNPLAALTVTTVVFTALHFGIFQAGIVSILSVIVLNVVFTLILELTDSLAASALAHFAWSLTGGTVLGVILIPDTYTSLFNCGYTGEGILAGNAVNIESSVVSLAVNIAAAAVLLILLKRKWTK